VVKAAEPQGDHVVTSTSSITASAGGNLDDIDYRRFRERVASRFGKATGPLFTTDVDLWPVYIDAFTEDTRRDHKCSACRDFLRRFGGLAVIGDRGQVTSAIWDPADADADHAAAVTAMAAAVLGATITGVFLSSTAALGRTFTGEWAHLSLDLLGSSPALHQSPPLTAAQKTAERTQDHGNVMRALAEFPLDLLERVVELLKADALYRSEKVLGPAAWLRDLAAATAKGNRTNLVWRAVATAPAGYCHPRSSMVGTLLEDRAGGIPFDAAAGRFAAKMHPLQYQRPQALLRAGQVVAAERLIDQLGIAAALPRRFARLEEIETLWRPVPQEPAAARGVFTHLLPAVGPERPLDVAEQKITWERFARIVLPDAVSLEVHAPERGDYCALVTAVHPAAPPILQWDRADRRNPVSWYVCNSGSPASQWGIAPGAWALVTAVTLHPSMWGGDVAHHERSAIAVIAGARDRAWRNSGSGLFPEILRSELHGARAIIEAYSTRARLTGFEEATACGLSISDRSEALVRVTTRTGSRFVYRIDRWD
jgi:hypothetical protein